MIRPFTETDTEAVCDLYYLASVKGQGFIDEVFWQKEREEVRQVYLPIADTWVAEVDGEIVAFISLLENEIGGLFVHPDHWRNGWGTKLIQHARGLHNTLTLNAFIENESAIAFYHSLGFEIIGESVFEETGNRQYTMRWSRSNK